MRRLAIAALLVPVLACTTTPTPTCIDCGGSCVDMLTDSFNCGACGTMCAGGQRCELGVCTATCAALRCGEACVDPQIDPLDCGACGHVCPALHAAATCIAGRCSYATCETGWHDCDLDEVNGCESNSDTCFRNVCANGPEGFQDCEPLGLSADGRRLLIISSSPLVPGDTNDGPDLFVFETAQGTFRRIVLPDLTGMGSPRATTGVLSGDGTTVAVIYVMDTASFRVEMMNLDNNTFQPLPNDAGIDLQLTQTALSYDGRYLTTNAECPAPDGGATRACLVRVDTLTGASFVVQLATRPNEIDASPDGQVLGYIDAVGGVPFVVYVDGGTPREVLAQTDAGFTGALPAFQIRLSYDARVIAFFDPVPDPSDFLQEGQVWVTGAGKARAFIGSGPSLSYDGQTLVVSRQQADQQRCMVISLDGGAQRLIDDPDLFSCTGFLSGDGRTLAMYDALELRVHLVRVTRP